MLHGKQHYGCCENSLRTHSLLTETLVPAWHSELLYIGVDPPVSGESLSAAKSISSPFSQGSDASSWNIAGVGDERRMLRRLHRRRDETDVVVMVLACIFHARTQRQPVRLPAVQGQLLQLHARTLRAWCYPTDGIWRLTWCFWFRCCCSCCCCCWVRRPVCHDRRISQSTYRITCSGSVARMSSGGSVVPSVASRCRWVAGQIRSQRSNVCDDWRHFWHRASIVGSMMMSWHAASLWRSDQITVESELLVLVVRGRKLLCGPIFCAER